MSVVIVGGNECMVRKYINICNEYDCDAKVFCKMRGSIKKQIGNPDLMIMFTNTLSHKLLKSATDEIKGSNTKVEWCHSSSASALKNALVKYI